MYKIFFSDNTSWQGGHYTDSKWFEMPDKEIVKIEYKLTEKTLILKDFEAYGHIVTRANVVSSKGQSKLIPSVIIMGKWNQKVYQTVFDFIKGKIYTKLVNYGEENNGKPDTSWHQGKWNTNIFPKMKFLN